MCSSFLSTTQMNSLPLGWWSDPSHLAEIHGMKINDKTYGTHIRTIVGFCHPFCWEDATIVAAKV
jgi:hypothetical protein